MPVVHLNGVSLNYQVIGNGKTIVLLHGYTSSSEYWASQIPELSAKYRVVVIDHRGHGKSSAPSGEDAYSIEIFADDVFALLKMLDVKECCLVGHSLGGFIALQFALDHQDVLAALVLVDTSSGELDRVPNFYEMRRKMDEIARTQGMEAAFEFELVNNPVKINRIQKHYVTRETIRQSMLATSVDGYIYTWRAIEKKEALTSRLGEIKVPTLIIWGEEDKPLAKAAQTLKEGIIGSELVTLKGVEHGPPQEAPEVYNRILLEFLDRIGW